MAEINHAEPLISVIVPVYNVENYLDKSIGSILAQTYQNLELILVDDGSKDASGAMCDAWRAKDARIRVIHQTNGGQALARNHGIDEAAGAYLAFIDSDDWIAPDYLETLYRLLQEHRAEISICDKQMIYESGGQAKSSEEEDQIREYTNREALKALFYQREIDNSPWGKLYRASLFNGVRFPEGKIYEDLGTIYRLLYQCDRVVRTSRKLYYYLQREGSTMYRTFGRSKMDRIEMSQNILDFIGENCPDLLRAAQCRYFISVVQVLRELPVSDPEYAEENRLVRQKLREYRRGVFTDHEAKKITRLIALAAYIPAGWLQKLGAVYKKFYD